jgi:uncharacterized protein (DUF1697 family)
MAAPLPPASAKQWLALRTPDDDFHTEGAELYWLCRNGQSQSKYFNVSFEKMLKTAITFRNVNTVARLAAKYPADVLTAERSGR